MLYSGTFVTEGNGRLLVTAVGDATEFGKIAGELGNAEKSSTPLQEKLARLGKAITVLGVIAAAIVFVAQLISRRSAFGDGDGGVYHQYRADCGGGAGGAAHHCGGVPVYQYY